MDNQLRAIIDAQLQDSVLHAGQIPAIDLYMDQIITLIEGHYEANRRHANDKLLTKTMINNYSKEGLISPVKGKKYTHEHIMQMLFVYTMKNSISIGEIKTALQHAYNDDDFDLTAAWEQSLAQKEIQRAQLPDILSTLCVPIGDAAANDTTQKMATLLAISSLSYYCQRIAEGMVQEMRSDLVP